MEKVEIGRSRIKTFFLILCVIVDPSPHKE